MRHPGNDDVLSVFEKFMDSANCALGEFISPISSRTFRAFRIIICHDAASPTRAVLDAISRTANYDCFFVSLRFSAKLIFRPYRDDNRKIRIKRESVIPSI